MKENKDGGFTHCTAEGVDAKNCCALFSVPYVRGSIGFMYRLDKFPDRVKKTVWKAALSNTMTNLVCTIFVISLVSGHCMWFIESRGGNAM